MPQRKPVGPPDPELFMAEIARAWTPGTPQDRYADFRAVFLSTERGKRVLYQLLSWCRLWGTSFDKDPYVSAFKEGERNMGLKILTALHVEPKPLPTRAARKPKGE